VAVVRLERSSASGGDGPVVAQPRALEFRRGQGRSWPTCGTGSFYGTLWRRWDGWLARGSRGEQSSSTAAMGQPPGTVIQRAGGTARATRERASSLGAGGSFRCAWGTGVVRRSKLTGTAPMADGGGSVLTRVKKGEDFMDGSRRLRRSLGTTLRPVSMWVAAWPEYGGQGGNVRARGRGTAATPLAGRRRSVSCGL
jgi:hypothetical protein